MKEDQDYIRDISEMRSMMERTTKFMSLSGLSGIMAGIYALAGAFIAHNIFEFRPGAANDNRELPGFSLDLWRIIFLALAVLGLSLVTAMLLSRRKADKSGEKLWNASARRLVINMAVPLTTGGLLILIMIAKGLITFVAPFTLIFYGLALYNASKFTYEEMRSLGLIQIALGLTSCFLPEYGLWFWATGFGLIHIIYGIYMHYRYER
ncbi:MAG: hypothetical protein EOP48_32305 [Sphingobacteriales bacterium]|nr:MAG: hypothetical protein EOP48_32305 [Sphingobacteriales bacterium]